MRMVTERGGARRQSRTCFFALESSKPGHDAFYTISSERTRGVSPVGGAPVSHNSRGVDDFYMEHESWTITAKYIRRADHFSVEKRLAAFKGMEA